MTFVSQLTEEYKLKIPNLAKMNVFLYYFTLSKKDKTQVSGFFFSLKTKDKKVKQFLSGGWYQWKGGGYKEG
jgi:hypothetical protein